MQKKLKKKKLQTEDLFLLVLRFCRALCVCGLSEIVIIVIAWKGAIQDLLTAREPSPTCTLKWPGRNLCANHMHRALFTCPTRHMPCGTKGQLNY